LSRGTILFAAVRGTIAVSKVKPVEGSTDTALPVRAPYGASLEKVAVPA